MALQIVDAGSKRVSRIVSVVYAKPNAGKTSLALTADTPILLDFDQGVHRAANRDGKALVDCPTWDAVDDMKPSDFDPYETVIVDAAGAALDALAIDIIKRESKYGNGGALTLQGYGVLKSRFRRWMADLQAAGKDIVLIAHVEEQQRKDDVVERLIASGASKQEIYRKADLMGRIYIRGDRRILTFNPSETMHGKNCGIPDQIIPVPGKDPQFFAKIVAEAKRRMNDVRDAEDAEQRRLETLREGLAKLTTADELNGMIAKMNEAKAKPVDKHILMDRAKELGIKFDRAAKAFVAPEPEPAPDGGETPPDPF